MRVGRTGSTDGRGGAPPPHCFGLRRRRPGIKLGDRPAPLSSARASPARAKRFGQELLFLTSSFGVARSAISCSLAKLSNCGTRTRRVDELGFKPTARTVFCPRNLPKLSVKLLRTLITQSYTSIQSFEQGPPRCSVLHGSLGAFCLALGGVSLLSIIAQLTTICGRSSRGSLATYIGCTRLHQWDCAISFALYETMSEGIHNPCGVPKPDGLACVSMHQKYPTRQTRQRIEQCRGRIPAARPRIQSYPSGLFAWRQPRLAVITKATLVSSYRNGHSRWDHGGQSS